MTSPFPLNTLYILFLFPFFGFVHQHHLFSILGSSPFSSFLSPACFLFPPSLLPSLLLYFLISLLLFTLLSSFLLSPPPLVLYSLLLSTLLTPHLCSPQQLCPLCLQLADLSLLGLDLTPQSLQLLVETHTHTP